MDGENEKLRRAARRDYTDAVRELHLDIASAVEVAKNKVKWIATQQAAIADVYKTLICEAVDAVPSDALTSTPVRDAVEHLLAIARNDNLHG